MTVTDVTNGFHLFPPDRVESPVAGAIDHADGIKRNVDVQMGCILMNGPNRLILLTEIAGDVIGHGSGNRRRSQFPWSEGKDQMSNLNAVCLAIPGSNGIHASGRIGGISQDKTNIAIRGFV